MLKMENNPTYWVTICCVTILLSGIGLFLVNYHQLNKMDNDFKVVALHIRYLESEVGRLELDMRALDIDMSVLDVDLKRIDGHIVIGGARIDSINKMVMSIGRFLEVLPVKVKGLKTD